MRIKDHLVPILIIILGVLLANSLYLSGKVDPNPLLQRAELTTSSVPSKITGQNTIDPNDGFTSQALGHRAAQDWQKGSIPYWNHYEGVGTPLAGEMQSGAFLPISLLLNFSNGLLYLHIILEITAGLATYLLLLKLKIKRKIALCGGLAFALNGTFAWIGNAAFNPIVFLPVLLLGIETAYQAAAHQKKRGWLLIALALAFSLAAGFPETAYLNGLFAGVWAVARFLQLSGKDFRQAFVRKLLMGGLVGLLLAAPVIVAFYGYVAFGYTGTHAIASTTGIVRIGMSGFFMPYIFGPIFSPGSSNQLLSFWSKVGGYVTASLLTLAIIGVTGKQERLLKKFLVGWIVVTLLGMYGLLGIMHLLNLVPGISSVTFYRYVTPSIEMAMVILASFGIADLVKGTVARKTQYLVAAAMIIMIAGGALNALAEVRHGAVTHRHLWMLLSVVVATGAVGAILIAVSLKGKLKEWALIGIVLAEVGVLFMFPQLSTPRHQQIDTQPVSFLQQNIGHYRFFTLGPIQPNYGSYFGIASININDGPVPKSYASYITKQLNNQVDPLVFTGHNTAQPPTALEAFIKNLPAYQELGVKYLVAPKGLVGEATTAQIGATKVFSSPAADIFALPNPQPYFEIAGGDCQLQVDTKDQATTNCDKPSSLVRREQFMKGWTATLNGKSGNVSEYHNLFQVVTVPAGTTHITYTYSPPHIKPAYLAALLGLVTIAVAYAPTSLRDTLGRR